MKKYLIYMHHGKLMTTEVIFIDGRCYKAADPRKWHSKVAGRPLVLSMGKVWCYESDLQKAKKIVIDNYRRYAREAKERALKIIETENDLMEG